jgi:hypothetical protein
MTPPLDAKGREDRLREEYNWAFAAAVERAVNAAATCEALERERDALIEDNARYVQIATYETAVAQAEIEGRKTVEAERDRLQAEVNEWRTGERRWGCEVCNPPPADAAILAGDRK